MDKKKLSKAKKKAKIRKIVNIVVNLFCVPIFMIVLFTSISVIIAAKHKTAPAFVGYSLISITTGSMEESGFGVGEIVMIKKNNPKALKKGDVIAYYRYGTRSVAKAKKFKIWKDSDKYSSEVDMSVGYFFGAPTESQKNAAKYQSKIMFHEIVDIRVDSRGELWFQTKGTSNSAKDSFYVNEKYIIGKYFYTDNVILSTVSYLYSNNLYSYVILVPILIICVVLMINIMLAMYTAILEQDVLDKKIKLDDPACVKRNVGYTMDEKFKYQVLAFSSPEERLDYISLLWKKAERPYEIQKHYMYQKLIYNKYEKLEILKEECNQMVRDGKDKKFIQNHYKKRKKVIDEEIEQLSEKLKHMKEEYLSKNEEHEDQNQNNTNAEIVESKEVITEEKVEIPEVVAVEENSGVFTEEDSQKISDNVVQLELPNVNDVLGNIQSISKTERNEFVENVSSNQHEHQGYVVIDYSKNQEMLEKEDVIKNSIVSVGSVERMSKNTNFKNSTVKIEINKNDVEKK